MARSDPMCLKNGPCAKKIRSSFSLLTRAIAWDRPLGVSVYNSFSSASARPFFSRHIRDDRLLLLFRCFCRCNKRPLLFLLIDPLLLLLLLPLVMLLILNYDKSIDRQKSISNRRRLMLLISSLLSVPATRKE